VQQAKVGRPANSELAIWDITKCYMAGRRPGLLPAGSNIVGIAVDSRIVMLKP
jgi:hypothetical protein